MQRADEPKFTDVDSSWIKKYHYDGSANLITLETASGRRFHVEDFSSDSYKAFLASKSKGKHFNDVIRKNHKVRNA
jgi:hypothetical protein